MLLAMLDVCRINMFDGIDLYGVTSIRCVVHFAVSVKRGVVVVTSLYVVTNMLCLVKGNRQDVACR